MASYPTPNDEAERLMALRNLDILDTGAELSFDRITALVRHILDVPTALISLVDQDRQWFKSRDGLDIAETPRSFSICAHAIMGTAPLIVPDTHADSRFADHPVVTGGIKVRSYTGAPIVLSCGARIGSLCGIDYVARAHPSDQAINELTRLARVVAVMIERRAPSVAAAEAAQFSACAALADPNGPAA